MDHAYHNQDYTFAVTTKVDGEEIVPDNVNITYTLYDGAHASLLTGSVAAASVFTITIPAAQNQVVLPYEARFFEYHFTYLGSVFTRQISYRVVNWVPLQVTSQDVLAAIGIDSLSASDLDIDLYEAYEWLEGRTQGDVSTRLAAGAVDAPSWNQCVKFRAALQTLPALRVALMSKEQQDNISGTRFKVDFEALERDLAARVYEHLLAGIKASSGVISLSDVPTVTISFPKPTDAITGV